MNAVSYIIILSLLALLPAVFMDSTYSDQGAEALLTKMEFSEWGWIRPVAMLFDEPSSALLLPLGRTIFMRYRANAKL